MEDAFLQGPSMACIWWKCRVHSTVFLSHSLIFFRKNLSYYHSYVGMGTYQLSQLECGDRGGVVWFSSHKTFPRDLLLVVNAMFPAKDSERNKTKLSCLGAILSGVLSPEGGKRVRLAVDGHISSLGDHLTTTKTRQLSPDNSRRRIYFRRGEF